MPPSSHPRSSRSRRFAPLALAAILTAVMAACYRVPVTGRKAVNLVDDGDVVQVSVKEFESMKARYPRSRNRDHTDALNRVGNRLSRVVFWDMPAAEWEFVVFDMPQQINAFAMAGGKVGVFSGLFRIIKNDDQLASVIAHEIAHVTARHIHERLSQHMLVQGGGVVGGVALLGTGASSAATSALLGVYDLTAGVQVLAFDRGKELEADLIGLHYMARAGYNPEAAIEVIEQLEAETHGQPAPSPWLSTHPTYPQRILQLIDELPRAKEIYQERGRQAAPMIVR